MDTTINAEAEKEEIIRRYRKLLKVAKPFLNSGDAKLIKKAFYTSFVAHKDMRRKSGEPYIFHPLAVAQIAVEEIGLGTTSIICALLHDVVEDTELEVSDIERDFGPKVAKIIDGLTKISTVSGHSVSAQAENFRKMILTLSDDVRVILIKLADRLHNMRTLDSMSREKQLKISSETIYLYAPLAHRLGLYAIKTELEDFYLKYTDENAYRDIAKKLQQTRAVRSKFIKDFITPLEKEFEKSGYEFEIKGRPKSIYSIYNKIKKQNTPFEEIYDLFAIRIILKANTLEQEKAACWNAYTIVTNLYAPNPQRLRDWVSTPKSNGYESLHTTVMSLTGQWVEIQIRTERMDEIAEKGYAAHWKYKENTNTSEHKIESWLSNIRDLLRNYKKTDTLEFLDAFRSNLYQDEVFVFTPKGDLQTLPAGATVVDFAFEIHSQIGCNCIGAKINNKLVPLSQVLKNGDQVEIITSSKQKPSEDWLKFVVTHKAKSKIKESAREDSRKFSSDGREIVIRKLNQLKKELNNETISQLLIYFNEKYATEFFHKVATQEIDVKDIKKVFETPLSNLISPVIDAKTFEKELSRVRGGKVDTLLIGEDMDKIDYTMAKCCNPISGDDVFGFVTVTEGIKIHRTTCPNAIELMSNYGYRIIKAKWTSQMELAFMTGIKVKGIDRVGMMHEITGVISNELKINIRNITIDTDHGEFDGTITVYVSNTTALNELITKLKNIAGVGKVLRFDKKM